MLHSTVICGRFHYSCWNPKITFLTVSYSHGFRLLLLRLAFLGESIVEAPGVGLVCSKSNKEQNPLLSLSLSFGLSHFPTLHPLTILVFTFHHIIGVCLFWLCITVSLWGILTNAFYLHIPQVTKAQSLPSLLYIKPHLRPLLSYCFGPIHIY